MKKLLFLLLLLSGCNSHKVEIVSNNFETSEHGITFLAEREGFKEYAYNDGTGYAIGFGNTFYENGTAVQKGDRISRQRAEILFKNILQGFEAGVNSSVTSQINQNQFDALISYSYNRGLGSFKKSNLLKMVNQNPENEAIRSQFSKEWGSNSKYKNGLIRRRKMEAELYFSSKPATRDFKLKYWQLSVLLAIALFRKELVNYCMQLWHYTQRIKEALKGLK